MALHVIIYDTHIHAELISLKRDYVLFILCCQTFGLLAQGRIPVFRLNETPGSVGVDESSPSIAADASGNFIVVWRDDRGDDQGDIYAQRVSAHGISLGSNFKVNDDGPGSGQESPSVACDPQGNAVVVWQDFRNGISDIYGQRLFSDGARVGANFRISDDENAASQWVPGVGVDGAGHIIVAWRDDRNPNQYFDIYAQRYANDGSPVDENFAVYQSDGESTGAREPCVDISPNGAFCVSWTGHGLSHGDVYARLYAGDAIPVGDPFLVNERDNFSIDDPGEPERWPFANGPAVAMDNTGKPVIAWQDRRNGEYQTDIYAQRYSPLGNLIGKNFRVNDDLAEVAQTQPAVDFDDQTNHFVIVWSDRRDGNDGSAIYAQRYTADGLAIGGNIQVSGSGAGQQSAPDVILTNNRILTVWRESGSATGDNILVNAIDWAADLPVESTCRLHHNFPNPFSVLQGNALSSFPGTVISYDLFVPAKVRLSIVDILGRRVRWLVCEDQFSGRHAMFWDGRDENGHPVGAGLYICILRLENGAIKTQRIVVVGRQ